MPDQVLNRGIELILWLQSLGDWLIVPMNAFTFTGNPEFYLLIMPAIYWCWDSRLGLRVAIIFLFSTGLNVMAKVIIHDPRPYWVDAQVRLLTRAETSFGIPSGHSQNAVAIWGLLATYLKSVWAWPAAILLIFFIGLSRMYLGVHFPTDVLSGWVIGGAILLLFLKLESPAIAYFNKFTQPAQIGLMFGISLTIILLGALIVGQTSDSWQPVPEWTENALLQAPNDPINPFSMGDIIITAATFFGIAGGAILFNARYYFEAGGPWRWRLGRYALGAVGVFILWRGLGFLFGLIAVEDSLLGYLLRYIQYTLIGGWVSALSLLVFMRLGLADWERRLVNSNW